MNDPGRFFLAAALLFGTLLAVVTPPFQVPDEPAHFYRAFTLSEGRLDLVPVAPPGGRGGSPLPASLHRICEDLFGHLPRHPERKISARAILGAFAIRLSPQRREPVYFPNGLQYTFVPYIPQALGIAAGRRLGAPALGLFYLARLANLLFGSLGIALAIRRLPAYSWLAAMVALTPMALSLLGSASADVTTLASSFLLVSTVARGTWGTEETTRGDLLLSAISSAVLCASKPPYLPLALLVLLIPAARFPAKRRGGLLLADLTLSLLATAWAVATSRSVAPIRPDVAIDAGRQVRDSLLHPFRFLSIMAADYVLHAPRYLSQIVGRLGWLDTALPAPFLALYLAVLLALAVLDTSPRVEVRPGQRGLAAVIVLAGATLVSASQYAIWTPYGADFIEGIQGRYLLPLVLPAVWIFHDRKWAGRIEPRRLGMALGAFSVLSCGIALWALARRYYGP
jgi:uncharacterized membrane protein